MSDTEMMYWNIALGVTGFMFVSGCVIAMMAWNAQVRWMAGETKRLEERQAIKDAMNRRKTWPD